MSQLVMRSDATRFRHRVITLAAGGTLQADIRAHGISVATLGLPRRTLASAFSGLLSEMRMVKPDVLQTWLPHSDLVGVLAARLMRVPVVAWNIRSSFLDLSKYSKRTVWTIRTCALLSRWPDCVICNSKAGRSYFSSMGYRPRRWELITNGFDLDRFKPNGEQRRQVRTALGVGDDAPVIGLIARFDPMKDHDTFLRAAARIHALHPEIVFVLAGTHVDASNTWLQARIQGLGLSSAVHLLGERSDIEAVYNALDVCTLSSSYGEGFPNVVGEAMASGVPCVVTDVGDAASMVHDVGMVVRPRDDQALASSWTRLIGLPLDERQKLGQRARKRVATFYSIDRMVARYEALYLDLVQSPRRRLPRLLTDSLTQRCPN